MPFSNMTQENHLYSVFLAPRGQDRMVTLGMQMATQFLTPFDKLVGVIGLSGSGKSMLIKGMFPGLELTNDDGGVNTRPLPLLSVEEDTQGFYSPHTYHLDVHFEAAFTPLFKLAEAVTQAISLGKRVVVEHFDLLRPHMKHNADLLIGIGEEVLITRPSPFGPEPKEIAKLVGASLKYRYMAHSAEDLCTLYIDQKTNIDYEHEDVRKGFVLSFASKPTFDIHELEQFVKEKIKEDLPISLVDDHHIKIGDVIKPCTGPRMHVKRTSKIDSFQLVKEFVYDPSKNRHLLVGMIKEGNHQDLSGLNTLKV